MSALLGWAVLSGLSLGVGLWMLVSLAPRLGRPALATRVAPYVLDLSGDARQILERSTVNPLPVVGVLFESPVRAFRAALDAVLGGSALTAQRLRQAGLNLSTSAFRSRQLTWAAIGGAAGILSAVLVSTLRTLPVGIQLSWVLFAVAAGFVGRDLALQRQAGRRMQRVAAELPTILEFLTLSLSAGEGILDALRRVSRISRGELAAELSTVVTGVATGLPLAETLTTLAGQLRLPAFTRAVEQITGALERGTPLADVLRAQAQDSRDQAKRDLLELSGKKEVAMLVPLVFLILPLTVIFAVFPGLFVLQVGL